MLRSQQTNTYLHNQQTSNITKSLNLESCLCPSNEFKSNIKSLFAGKYLAPQLPNVPHPSTVNLVTSVCLLLFRFIKLLIFFKLISASNQQHQSELGNTFYEACVYNALYYESTYNALQVVMVKVRIRVNPAYNYEYIALQAHYNAL